MCQRSASNDEDGSSSRPIYLDDVDNCADHSPESDRGSWNHAVERVEDLSLGDQVYVYRGPIQHHGIVTHIAPADALSQLEPQERVAAIHVVHFDSAVDAVELITLEAFLNGNPLHRAQYSADAWASSLAYGASYADPADEAKIIVRRATEAAAYSRTNGWSGYSLLTNNCETFACWCSTGRRHSLSRQAVRGLLVTGGAAAGIVGVTIGAEAVGLAYSSIPKIIPKSVEATTRWVTIVQALGAASVGLYKVAEVVNERVTGSRMESSHTN